MPLPAGTGLDRRSFLARSVGLAIAVYGATALTPRALDDGIAQALAAGPSDTVLVTVFLDGGIDSLSVLFPYGDPDYRRLRPKLALADSGLVVPGGHAPALASLRGRLPHAARRGQARGAARRRVHERRPVALHVAPLLGGRRHRLAAPDRMARPLPRPRRQGRQPAPGREPRRRALTVARDREEAGRRAERRRATTRSGRRASAARSRTACCPQSARSGASRGHDRALARRAGGHVPVTPAAPAARALQRAASRPPVPYPKSNSGFPDQMAGLAAMLAAGLPLHCVAISANGGYDTHSDQAQTSPTTSSSRARRCSRSSATSRRAGSGTAC